MATPTAHSYTVGSGEDVYAGLFAPGGAWPVTSIVPDGIWSWFTKWEAVQHGEYIYIGWVNSSGTCGVSQVSLADGVVKHKELSAVGLEVDDHNNTSVLPLPDGQIAFFYTRHVGNFRYRVWNPALGTFDSSGSAWTAEQERGNGSMSYPSPRIFSVDTPKVWLFQRRYSDTIPSTAGPVYRSSPTLMTAVPHTWSGQTEIFQQDGSIVYWRNADDGTNRIHYAITNGHPQHDQTSLYHFYGQIDGAGAMRFYRSDGTEYTGALPMGPSDATLVYDGSSVRCWLCDSTIDAAGRLRILWLRYPGNDGQQIEYWHARWTGSAWANHKITDDGPGLYVSQIYYPGGGTFDRLDANRIYLSAPIAGVRQIQEWRTADDGASWTQHRVLTSGGTAGNPLRARPVGIKGGDGRVRVVWWEGTYNTTTSYFTQIKGAG